MAMKHTPVDAGSKEEGISIGLIEVLAKNGEGILQRVG
jgi:hypothetical protein